MSQEWAEYLDNNCKFEHRPGSSWPKGTRAENAGRLCDYNPTGKDQARQWWDSPLHKENVSAFDYKCVSSLSELV